ncbi:hypothetical protein BT69DRAFT_1282091 [Atractiella rhizophila]|nr:hypothetical protein BT69DRAFT_1282091 [Atractiella rhizophila]
MTSTVGPAAVPDPMEIPKNVHDTIDAAGEDESSSHFAEEPLSIPASHGLGFPDLKWRSSYSLLMFNLLSIYSIALLVFL